jgi:allophanate hydrolase
VSIFSLNVDDAMIALNVMAGYDATDPYSRDRFVSR